MTPMSLYRPLLGAWLSGKNPQFELFFKGKHVLDVGCGEGALVRMDPQHFCGIDINETLLAKLKDEGLNVKFGAATAIPYGDGEFDAIQCSNIIEHLPPAEAHLMLIEMSRVLKPGGIIVLTTPMPRTVWNTFGHIKPYPPSAIRKILRPISLESFDSIHDLQIKGLVYYGTGSRNKVAFLLTSFLALWLDTFRGSYTILLEKRDVQHQAL